MDDISIISEEETNEKIDQTDRFKKLENTIKTQIEQVEEELNILSPKQSVNSNDTNNLSTLGQQRNTSTQQLRHLQTYSAISMTNEFSRYSKTNLLNDANYKNNKVTNNSSDIESIINNDTFLPAKTSRVTRNLDSQNNAAYWEQVLNLVHQGKEGEAIYALIRVVQRLVDEKANKRIQQEKASKSYVDSLYERVIGNVKENLTQQIEDSCDDLLNQVMSITNQIGELKQFFQRELKEITNQISIMKEENVQNETVGIKNTSRSSEKGSSRARSAFSVFSAKG